MIGKSGTIWRIWLTALLLYVPRVALADPKPLLVHYMPWFVAQPYSPTWGWHWTMNHYNPDSMDGSGRREIASWYYPQIGPYDSLDPVVLEYHVLLMKLAGIDGVIVDWYGSDNYVDYGAVNQRTLALLAFAGKARLKFSLCYEDAAIRNEINGGYLSSNNAIAHAQQTMLYAQTNYLNHGSYLRWNGKPVLLNFGPQYFTAGANWQAIFSVLDPTNQPAFFTEDNRISPSGTGAFNWPPMSLSQTNAGVLTTNALESYLNNFQTKAASWPASISGSFPRFHDIYQQAGAGPSYGNLDDAGGNTLTNTLVRAMTNASAVIQMVTWNDFGEGTVIEPTREYGYRDLGIIQALRRQYQDPGFSYTTNDLAFAYRVYQSRRQYASDPYLSAELDRVFTNAVSGDLTTARLQLFGIESNRLVIYDCGISSNQFHFAVGGYVSGGLQILGSTNLNSGSWQNVTNYPPATAKTVVVAPVATGGAASFYKVQGM